MKNSSLGARMYANWAETGQLAIGFRNIKMPAKTRESGQRPNRVSAVPLYERRHRFGVAAYELPNITTSSSPIFGTRSQ